MEAKTESKERKIGGEREETNRPILRGRDRQKEIERKKRQKDIKGVNKMAYIRKQRDISIE